ncbi:MAG: DUF507 family protein [Deltaproteobacteria bacterium]|nr:DUF507 family protein [Deltaproteobacteria bacterium]
MRLYPAKISLIAADILRGLTQDGDIELEDRAEAEEDLCSVMREYLRQDREITERAKDRAEKIGAGNAEVHRIKRKMAEDLNFGLGGEAVSWILDQAVQMLMRSSNVAEIFAEDPVLRRKMRAVLERYMNVDDEMDTEVRSRLKHLSEGTQNWEVEYARVMEQIKRRHNVD